MKSRTRESLFQLISTECAAITRSTYSPARGRWGSEALSLGAVFFTKKFFATFIESTCPSRKIVEEIFAPLWRLTIDSQTAVTSSFLWAKRYLTERRPARTPWLVFFSPPNAFFHERPAIMLDLNLPHSLHSPRVVFLLAKERDEPVRLELSLG